MTPLTHLERFLTAKAAAGRSPRTLEWYRQQIRVYLNWLAGDELAIWDQAATIERYLAAQRRRKALRATTIAARFRALRAWFAWLAKRGIVATSPLAVMDRPSVPKTIVRHVTLEEFRRLYRSIPSPAGAGTSCKSHHNRWPDYRDRALLLLLYWSGLRVSEVVGLQLGDVDTAAQLLTVRHGKGGKDRIVPCTPDLALEMFGYLVGRPAWSGAALFVSNDGYGGARGPLTAEGVRQMLRRRCKAAGVRYMNPHSFRHGFAMAMLNSGMQMSAVSDVMGHSSEQVTAGIYAHWLIDGLKREYDQARMRLESTHNG